jgi:glycosyltransferase involved in cell wall biosynthesis
MRVLFFDHIASMSGGEIALLHLVQHLDRAAVEPIVVLGAEGPLALKLRPVAEVHVLPMEAGVAQARKDALGAGSILRLLGAAWAAGVYVWQLSRFIRAHRLALVHTNTLKADILGGLAARLAGVPVIWHVRDRIADDYLPRKVVKAFLWMSGWLPTAMIANSYATAATLTPGVGKHKPIYVVHDGTPLASFRPVALSGSVVQGHNGRNPSNGAMVGIVGRISPWKGQDVFLRAARLVRASYPQARFRIIGSALFNEAAYEAHVNHLVAELGLDSAVEFRGFREDVAAEIAQLDVCVHASTRPEPFGQVIIEAMAAGVPVVATNAGGVPEIVQDGVTGLLVPMNDAEAMAAAVASLLADPSMAESMGRRGSEDVEQRFSIRKTASEVERVFLEVTHKNQHTP